MKPSGIEWIGDIPDDWEVRRLKGLGEQTIGLTYSPQDITDNSGTLVLRSSNIQNGKLVLDRDDNVYVSIDVENKILKDEDILICSRNGSRNLVGKTAFVITYGKKLSYGAFTTIFRSKYNKFLFYVFNAGVFEYHLASYNTSTINQLTTSMLNEIRVPFPPVKTQQKIADYLDEKCGEIDATIAKQKESIEKLKAYKQSLISETVTKGLDKSAPLKPSGIEWIGDIPDDWEVTKISRLYSIQLGKMLQPEKKSSGDTYEPYICAANLSSGTFRLDEVKYMWISEPEKDIYRLKRDDLLVTEGGDVGISSIWKDDISPCYFQNALHRVVPKKGNSNRFLHYWLIVLKSVGYIDLICNKSTIAHFTKEKFAQSLILSIPLQTQEKIADYLDSKCSQIDKYITEKQNIIQKLDAYKKSLIFECITGKHKIY